MDNLSFEGEYKNGKRGKEYYDNGKLKFVGEYLDEKRNGKGNEYNEHTGKLEFIGQYLYGERWNIQKFEGKSLNGKRIKRKYKKKINKKL